MARVQNTNASCCFHVFKKKKKKKKERKKISISSLSSHCGSTNPGLKTCLTAKCIEFGFIHFPCHTTVSER